MIRLFARIKDWWVDHKLRRQALQFIACEADRAHEKPPAWVIDVRSKLDAVESERANATVAKRCVDATLNDMLRRAPEAEIFRGEPWTFEQEQDLRRAYALSATLEQLIMITGRQRGGVIARLILLNLVLKRPGGHLIDARTGEEVLQ